MKLASPGWAVFLALSLVGWLAGLRAAEPPGAAGCAYRAKVAFREKRPLAFPDFTLTYVGQHRSTPPPGLHPWVIHDFMVIAGGHSSKVTWSAGTGDVAPVEFTAAGKAFLLELSRSEILGRLGPKELVVRPAEGKR